MRKFTLFSVAVVLLNILTFFLLPSLSTIINNDLLLISTLAVTIYILPILSASILLGKKLSFSKFLSYTKYFFKVFLFIFGLTPFFPLAIFWLIMRSFDVFLIVDNSIPKNSLSLILNTSKKIVLSNSLKTFAVLALSTTVFYLIDKLNLSLLISFTLSSLVIIFYFWGLFKIYILAKKTISKYTPMNKLWYLTSIIGWGVLIISTFVRWMPFL